MQHDAQWVSEGPDSGRISIFNNGTGRPGGNASSVDLLLPDFSQFGNPPAAVPYGPDSLEKTWMADPPTSFYATFISGAQVQPNGNVLITNGPGGYFIESSWDGDLYWEYVNPVGLSIVSQGDPPPTFDNVFRSTRYGRDYDGFDSRDLSGGDPVELSPIPYACTIYPEQPCTVPTDLTTNIMSPVQVGVSWNGPATFDLFQLRGRPVGAPNFISRFESSESKVIGGLTAGTTYEWTVRARCTDGTITDFAPLETFTTPTSRDMPEITVISQPDFIYVESTTTPNKTRLLNMAGQVVRTGNQNRIPTGDLPQGVYIVELQFDEYRLTEKVLR